MFQAGEIMTAVCLTISVRLNMPESFYPNLFDFINRPEELEKCLRMDFVLVAVNLLLKEQLF